MTCPIKPSDAWVPGTGPLPAKPEPDRACARCGDLFIPNTPRTKHCSIKCAHGGAASSWESSAASVSAPVVVTAEELAHRTDPGFRRWNAFWDSVVAWQDRRAAARAAAREETES